MLIAYYRVSTARQGRSGLGLEAQQAAVEQYARSAQDAILESFTEVESGRRCDRPQLGRALALAKGTGATLVVAKLDRLARNVAFLSRLMDSRVKFVACDNPHATRLTIHILAAVAESEAVMISDRVRAALAAYKARGGILGGRDPRCNKMTDAQRLKGSRAARESHRAASAEFRSAVRPVAESLLAEGKTLREAAGSMNASGYRTRRGRPWSLATVHALITRYAWES